MEVPALQTLLSALEQAGGEAMSNCRHGEFGRSPLDVLGVNSPIDHRDVFFSDAQEAKNRTLYACVSPPARGLTTGDLMNSGHF